MQSSDLSDISRSRQVERVVLRLRQLVLEGRFSPGEHLAEIALAEMLGGSRTPIRTALAILEREGLLVSAPRRGYCVREVTVGQIVDAIDVRGALEALACRLALERGLTDEAQGILHDCLSEGQGMLAHGSFDESSAGDWAAMNSRFHAAIVAAAGNEPLADAIAHNARLPMVAAGAIAFHAGNLDVAFGLMRSAHADHVNIVNALSGRQTGRAQALILEHAYTTRENLRIALEKYRCAATGVDVARIPGLKLIIG